MKCISPFAMLRLPAWGIMIVKMVFAVCIFFGDLMSEKAASVSAVNCFQFAFLSLVNVCLFCCSLYLVRVLIVAIIGR